MPWPKRGNKFGAITSTYNGHTYHSKREAIYAQELDLRVRAGDLKEWRRQVRIPLVVNTYTVAHYTIDFVELHKDGTETYTEVKGFPTPEWRLKWKLFDALYPHLRKQVVP